VKILSKFIVLLSLFILIGCTKESVKSDEMLTPQSIEETINKFAESYVKIMLGMDIHEPGYVDAYYGPQEYKDEANAMQKSLVLLRADAKEVISGLRKLDLSGEEEILQLRHQYLIKQLESVQSRIDMNEGMKFTFEKEAKEIFDVTPPVYSESHFQEIINEIGELLPGTGTIQERLNIFRSEFVVPVDKLDAVFEAAIAEARARTSKYIELPENDNFELEYVTGKSWTGYNWYKGNSHSLIQLNIEFPLYIDRAIDVACHEGYPGHHLYNALLEKTLARGRGWVEFTVNPLYSSQSIISEGSANFGIEVVFPGEERTIFEREVLFPLAGLDPGRVEEYYDVMDLVGKLNYVSNEVARGYLNGDLDRSESEEMFVNLALMTPERAAQRVRFIDQYRAYVINYNLGKDLVREYIESRGGTADNPEKRWEEFIILLSSPRLPSSLN